MHTYLLSIYMYVYFFSKLVLFLILGNQLRRPSCISRNYQRVRYQEKAFNTHRSCIEHIKSTFHLSKKKSSSKVLKFEKVFLKRCLHDMFFQLNFILDKILDKDLLVGLSTFRLRLSRISR